MYLGFMYLLSFYSNVGSLIEWDVYKFSYLPGCCKYEMFIISGGSFPSRQILKLKFMFLSI